MNNKKNKQYKIVRNLIGKSGVYGIKIDNQIRCVGSGMLEKCKSTNLSALRNNKHANKKLQQLFNINFDFEFIVLQYVDLELVYTVEKFFTEKYKDTIVNVKSINSIHKKIRSEEESKVYSLKCSELNKGELNPNCNKLDDVKVSEILYLKHNTNMKKKDIAIMYGISYTYCLRLGKDRWIHIDYKTRPSFLDVTENESIIDNKIA